MPPKSQKRRSATERRYDPAFPGEGPFTEREFVEFYGPGKGQKAWQQATPVAAATPSRPTTAAPAPAAPVAGPASPASPSSGREVVVSLETPAATPVSVQFLSAHGKPVKITPGGRGVLLVWYGGEKDPDCTEIAVLVDGSDVEVHLNDQDPFVVPLQSAGRVLGDLRAMSAASGVPFHCADRFTVDPTAVASPFSSPTGDRRTESRPADNAAKRGSGLALLRQSSQDRGDLKWAKVVADSADKPPQPLQGVGESWVDVGAEVGGACCDGPRSAAPAPVARSTSATVAAAAAEVAAERAPARKAGGQPPAAPPSPAWDLRRSIVAAIAALCLFLFLRLRGPPRIAAAVAAGGATAYVISTQPQQ